MKRNYSFRTDKFSLFLFGMGAGLLSMVPATYAQTQLLPLAESVPKIRSPRELMPATTWNRPSIAEADKLVVRSPDTLNHVIVNPDLTKTLETLEVQENVIPAQSPSRSNSDAIRVDSTVFDLDSKKPADTVQSDVVQDDITPPNQLEFKQLQPLKFPVNWNRLQPIKQSKQVGDGTPEAPKVASSSKVSTTGLMETAGDPIAAKQVSGSSENSETAVPKVSQAFLRKPMDIMDPTIGAKDDPVSVLTQITPSTLLQSINALPPIVEVAKEKITKQPSLATALTYDFQTPLPTGTISLFVDGPDYLSVDQVGEYEIAVANSSSNETSVTNISLLVPRGVEIIAVQREAEIDDQERTMSWTIDKIGSGKQQRIRFRVKSASAGKVDFAVTVSQNGRESQTVSQTTIIR